MTPLKRKIYDTLTGIRFVEVTKDELSESLIEVINQTMYSDKEVYKLLDTLWDSLDIWYNNPEHGEFSLRKWFDNCELKK